MKTEAPSPHRSTSPAVTQDHQPPYPTLLGYASCSVRSGDGLLPPGTGFSCKEGGKVPCNVTGVQGMTSYPSSIVAVLPERATVPSVWGISQVHSQITVITLSREVVDLRLIMLQDQTHSTGELEHNVVSFLQKQKLIFPIEKLHYNCAIIHIEHEGSIWHLFIKVPEQRCKVEG